MVKILATPRKILWFPRQGLGGMHLLTNAVAWRPMSHTSAAQRGGGYQLWPRQLCSRKEVN